MKIKGIEGMSIQDLQTEVYNGGKFIIYSYCISVVVMTFKRGTDIYFVKANENAVVKGLPWTLLSFVLGWWGLPWGIIYTIGTLATNLGGGKDVTDDVMNFIHAQTNGPVFDFDKEVTKEEEEDLEKLKGDLEK